jgi:polynucleotide 5'-triphosphatase
MLGHRPAILQAPLNPLGWSTAPGGDLLAGAGGDADKLRAGKRPRPVAVSSEPNGVQAAQPPRVVERIVERVVEKFVPIAAGERLTILGLPPLADDRVRNLVNFILQHVTSPGVEIEAKLGVLIEKNQNVRACELLPVLCETPIRSEVAVVDTRFESAVHQIFFAHLNVELNRRVDSTSTLEDETAKVEYIRAHEVDFFWPGSVRETRRIIQNEAGQEVYQRVRVQRKTRLGDLNFVCPLSDVDVRYSASLEADAPAPSQNAPDPAKRRVKDRISYKFDSLSVDITRVELHDPAQNMHGQTSHEIEVEIDATANLYAEVEKYRVGDPSSKVFQHATSLVNTVRLLMEEINRAATASDDAAQGAHPAADQQQTGGAPHLNPPDPLEMSPHQ